MPAVAFSRVSFDYDSCLQTNAHVQGMARELVARGFAVYVLTAREDIPYRNPDLLALTAKLGILPERILYSFTSSKLELVKAHRIGLHYDNDPDEVALINQGGFCAVLTDWTTLSPDA